MPKRIQRKRTKGWRMPEGAVYVGRPSKWGNPFAPAVIPGWGDQPWRPDAPNVGLFANFRDAIAEATFRAAVTRCRYRVRLEPNNHWWQITEGAQR